MTRQIMNGHHVRDTFTGFTGLVVGLATYLTGCDQACVRPTSLNDDGSMKSSSWIDIGQLEIVDERIFKPPNLTAAIEAGAVGGPRSDAPPIK